MEQAELFSRYQRSEQALVLALMEMVLNGVSTRKVARITEELCGTEFAKSTVSDLCKRLDPIVRGWNGRELRERRYAFVLVDALVLRIRDGDHVRPFSAMIAIGVNLNQKFGVTSFAPGSIQVTKLRAVQFTGVGPAHALRCHAMAGSAQRPNQR